MSTLMVCLWVYLISLGWMEILCYLMKKSRWFDETTKEAKSFFNVDKVLHLLCIVPILNSLLAIMFTYGLITDLFSKDVDESTGEDE